MVLHILIFVFREETGRQETLKRLVANIPQILSALISSWMKFWSVTAAHPASYPVGSRGPFPGGEAAGTWSWSLTSI
jgi:hypothetical protein